MHIFRYGKGRRKVLVSEFEYMYHGENIQIRRIRSSFQHYISLLFWMNIIFYLYQFMFFFIQEIPQWNISNKSDYLYHHCHRINHWVPRFSWILSLSKKGFSIVIDDCDDKKPHNINDYSNIDQFLESFIRSQEWHTITLDWITQLVIMVVVLVWLVAILHFLL